MIHISKKSFHSSKTRNSEGESHFKVVKEYYSKVYAIFEGIQSKIPPLESTECANVVGKNLMIASLGVYCRFQSD